MILSKAKIKCFYVVEKVENCLEKTALEAMGFVNGTKVYIAAKSLLNKTLLINLLNSTVAIKNSVLQNVVVRECAL